MAYKSSTVMRPSVPQLIYILGVLLFEIMRDM
uniref:Uncharacterized protein n=1 Tax=Arundo donax TaxID=35708 RepID=A0A0A9A012_ARUDO